MGGESCTVHASAVAFDLGDEHVAILLSGASGSGKSALALNLLALGARLVSDDQTILTARAGTLVASAPAALHGLIEWRGVGLLPAPALDAARAVAWMDLDTPASARMPEAAFRTKLGVRLPCLSVPPGPALAAGVLRYMLSRAWQLSLDDGK